MDENNTPEPEEPTPASAPEMTQPPVGPPAEPEVPDTSSASTPPPGNPYVAPSGKGLVPWSTAPDPAVPSEEKTQALLCWVLGLLVSFVAPLVFLLISKDKPFVYHHAAQSLSVAIVVLVLAIVAIATCIGMVLLPFISLAALALCIMGAIAANAGSRFVPPLTGAVSKALFKA